MKKDLGIDEALAQSSEDEEDPYITKKNKEKKLLYNRKT